jgi:hypothetical protein
MAMLYGSNGNNGDTKSASGGSAQYTGNYLNWYFGSSPTGWGTDARNKPGTQRRIDIAQGAASTLVSTLNNVRVGLASYNGEAGATINVGIDDIASNRTALTTAINALSPSGFTPLAESLYDIGRDFVGEANPQYDGPLVLHPDAASPITLDDDTVFDHSPTYAAGVALNGADLATAQRDELRKDAANNTENEATGMARLGYLRGTGAVSWAPPAPAATPTAPIPLPVNPFVPGRACWGTSSKAIRSMWGRRSGDIRPAGPIVSVVRRRRTVGRRAPTATQEVSRTRMPSCSYWMWRPARS